MPERPSELIYALDEKPPWPQLLALGFQHVAIVCPYLVMVALVAEAASPIPAAWRYQVTRRISCLRFRQLPQR